MTPLLQVIMPAQCRGRVDCASSSCAPLLQWTIVQQRPVFVYGVVEILGGFGGSWFNWLPQYLEQQKNFSLADAGIWNSFTMVRRHSPAGRTTSCGWSLMKMSGLQENVSAGRPGRDGGRRHRRRLRRGLRVEQHRAGGAHDPADSPRLRALIIIWNVY
jgi:hypothetical protein